MSRYKRRYDDRITVDPKILVGKPTIKGTRMSVELVLNRLAEELTEESLRAMFRSYPHITVDDVKACVQYAADLIAGEEIDLAATTPGSVSRVPDVEDA